jgi:hypothetical protein
MPEDVLFVDQGEMVRFEVDAAAGQKEVGLEGFFGAVVGARVVGVELEGAGVVFSKDVLEDLISDFGGDAAIE